MIVMFGFNGLRKAAICRKAGRASRIKLGGWDAATAVEEIVGAVK
ncbi:MAG: hypothetical protein OQK79_08755 [Rhodanobacter sp.]|jgi:hypothetical protein|nr:hypothetical protein [Rhodanobacter sp.]